MAEYRVTKCLCHSGEPLSTSINNPRNYEYSGTFDTKEKAEAWKVKLKKIEADRINRERATEKGWSGNEFVFWIDEVTNG